jgi:hypothetical protein
MAAATNRAIFLPGVGRVLVLVVLVLAGCSKASDRLPVFPVHGKVLVGGEPATEAFVAFHPDPDNPAPGWIVGQVDAEGNFALSTYVSGDGAPEGEYTVTITWQTRGGLMNRFSGPDRLKGRYADPKTSKLRFRVEKKPLNEVPPYEL